eukprot:scaffold93996_cov55-Attheya_sp.AAC.4
MGSGGRSSDIECRRDCEVARSAVSPVKCTILRRGFNFPIPVVVVDAGKKVEWNDPKRLLFPRSDQPVMVGVFIACVRVIYYVSYNNCVGTSYSTHSGN